MKINTMEKTAIDYRLRIDVIDQPTYLTLEPVDNVQVLLCIQ